MQHSLDPDFLNLFFNVEPVNEPISNSLSNAYVPVERQIIFVIDLLPPTEDVNEAQWTIEWLKSSHPSIETQLFKGIDACWPTESELTGCLGVVLTGSTCSCVNNYAHTEPLFLFFKTVIHLEVPVLAICYSAQMLVRWLAGKENVMRLPEPHVGFVRVEFLMDRALGRCSSVLSDVVDGSLISSSAQSDGFILPDELKEFSVQVGSGLQKTRFVHAASATKWKHQAFQLSGLPVWGVQFHPNWPANGAETVFRILKLHNLNVVVEKQGNVDEDERRCVACRFISACRHHWVLTRNRKRTEPSPG
jgi:GMP synthase-like glutamine amidotransferase